MKMRSILAACVILTGSAQSIAADWDREREQPFGPSYDCRQAQSALDLTVCSDPLLSRMELELSIAYGVALENSGSVSVLVNTPVGEDSIPSMVPLRERLEEEQRQWLQAREGSCKLDFDFNARIDARFEAVPCLINSYAKRLVELEGERRILSALAETGIIVLSNVELDLGDVRIDLPRVLPVARNATPKLTIPHPACIDALLGARIPSSLHRDACRAGTGHLPLAPDSFWEDGDHAVYLPWHPNRWDQRGDSFGYRVLDELRDGRTLLHVTEEATGASRTHVDSSLAVAHGFQRGDTIVIERRIFEQNLSGFCGGGIHEVEIADGDTLRLASTIPADRLMTLFDAFPEELHGVSDSDRRRLRALKSSGAFDVAMSMVGITCIGRVGYSYDIDTDRRTFLDVSLEVTERDRAAVEHIPALACLFDLLLDRHSDMPVRFQPPELGELVMGFIDTCEMPGT